MKAFFSTSVAVPPHVVVLEAEGHAEGGRQGPRASAPDEALLAGDGRGELGRS
jgi:hypothetical protein